MPLRDHFHPPLDNMRHWESFLAGWPVMIVAGLHQKLPRGYFAEPWTYPTEQMYRVLVYDEKRHRLPVATVEIVSPANKERGEHRRMFAAKCAGQLREHVSVVIVDVVTTCAQNLYLELFDVLGQSNPTLGPEPSPLYAAACRMTDHNETWKLATWFEPLNIGEPLPTMPLWLADNLAVPLELEASYEQSCKILGIP